MFQSIRASLASLPEQLREGGRRRAAGLLLAVLAEVLLVLLLFTLGASPFGRKEAEVTLSTFDASPVSEDAQAPSEADAPEPRPAERPAAQETEPEPEQTPPQPKEAQPAPQPPPMIQLSRDQMAAVDIASLPARPRASASTGRSRMGPVDTGTPSDTPRVGTGPNGEPLYAASWYREPDEGELRGYLSTAQGPGWGLIACRTVPNYRVEDCVFVDEYPAGSNIARAVLAAAWQFRVRPPRLGGRVKIGEWVRIRIDYERRRQ